ncbi:wax ester/triacylglycerol synthase family O-acyltransferase [Rhodococcus sp. D2-41]|uniref:WS/DGAT/MGAT family O-acyltransferase n=1 Tax=Speluncibacter jeojiensis TaxID=2710754 RepID=UPI00240FAF6E|nr:wax ester/triacylglycerol synthase family O-acyltransferase [Rhodococcus sp. D2-41]MDG3008786.1 wax ester/triacylglycerol synthase family O-acyltransferase [Rhodococcus sp. D2-41]
MVSRLDGQDAAFYYLETAATPAHIGSLAIFETPKGGVDYEDLLALVDARLALVPRYRQKVREVARGLARPVWVDDLDFDLTYHVRRSALPKPGSTEQLTDLVARLSSRLLDRRRPLWEMYLIEGLEGGRFAIFTKSHQVLVDGVAGREIDQVVLDPTPTPRQLPEEMWMPRPEPGTSSLLLGAAAELVTSPGEGVELVRHAVGDVAGMLGRATKLVTGVASILRSATNSAPASPLNVQVSNSRRCAVATTRLADYRAIRARYRCSINDVILTVMTGALRNWLISRGEPVQASSTIRVLVPISVYSTEPGVPDEEQPPAESPARPEVSSVLVDLPVGELNPVVRLSQVAHAMGNEPGPVRQVAASSLVRLSGFAPPTMHAMSARVASTMSRRAFNLVITNAPGPQMPLYVAGAKMVEIYPVAPLLRNQALTVGLTSYDGKVFYGMNGDRDAMPDLDLFPELIRESVEELLDACG